MVDTIHTDGVKVNATPFDKFKYLSRLFSVGKDKFDETLERQSDNKKFSKKKLVSKLP